MFRRLNMEEAILRRHRRYSPPATQNTNTTRTPIDGIFVTPGIVVTRAGYDAFDAGCPSDHRLLYIDITTRSIFGFSPQNIYWSQAKRFSGKDPRRRKKYIKYVRKLYDRDKITEAVLEIQTMRNNGTHKSTIINKYNEVHKKITQIRRRAEKHARKLKVGGTQWSPKLQAIRDRIELWHFVKRSYTRVKTSKQKIKRLAKKCNVLDANKTPFTTATQNLKQAKSDLKLATKQAPAWRKDHLNSLARAIAMDTNAPTLTVKKTLIHRERQRIQHQRIKRVTAKRGAGAATKIYYTDRFGTRKEAVDKQDIESACIAEGLQRFTQCQTTPIFQEPLLGILGTLPDAETTRKILYGQLEIPENTNQYARKLLLAMKLPVNFTETSFLPAEITTEQHIKQWRRQKENKAADPSGLGFTHFIAGSFDKQIAEIDATMRSIPRELGFSPDAWQVITDFQILKKSGVFDIDKMRIIQLMHSEFNANNKHDGRTMMANAEKHQSLVKDQFGSRKNH